MQKVFYLCNGKREECGKRGCYINGGICKHTTDVRYAKNFHKKCLRSAYWENETASEEKTQFRKGIRTVKSLIEKWLRLLSRS